MTGRIVVNGIRFHGFHGVSSVEREFGVRCRVDVAIDADLTAPALSDRVEDAIDYGVVHEVVLQVARGNSYRLLETLGYRVACALMDRFAGCRNVALTVTKETPILDGMVDAVGIELALDRLEWMRLTSEGTNTLAYDFARV